MNERLKQILNKITETFKKLSVTQKLISGVIVIALVGAFVFILTYSSSKPEVLLFEKPLDIGDFGKITAELQKANIPFDIKNDQYIIVRDKETGKRIRMELAQKNLLPNGIKGWELFDMQKWNTTEFERDVNLRRSIIGEITRHLKTLDWIEDAKINITMPKKTLYTAKETEVTASVTIIPAPNSYEYLENRKVIRGVERIVAYGVDNLQSENIVISDHHGNILNDFTEDDAMMNVKLAKEQTKIIDKKRTMLEAKIIRALSKVLTEDRVRINVGIEMNFDENKISKKEVLPVILKEDNPETPYDDSKYVETVPVSEKKITENFKGPGFIPEGPPGVEPNLPPGYKGNIDKFSEYTKNEEVINHNSGYKETEVKKDSHDIDSVSVAVYVDGTWEKIYDDDGEPIFASNTYVRTYIPYPNEDLKKLEELTRAAINYNASRGDLVVVKNIRFDRSKEFEVEDNKFRKQQNIKNTLILSLLILLGLFVGTIVYRGIKREIIRRKRLREQELARKQQLMRESILKSAEEEMPEDQLSSEDKERMELAEKANRVVQESPEMVAKLIKTWLAEE
ncbi:flagellar basal-body MS-ring/collar protein FliF [Spirochaetota bacterium]